MLEHIGPLPFHRKEINALLQINYSTRTPPCGHISFVNSPSLWTLVPHVQDRLWCGLWPLATPSFTSVDTSLLWTLFVRPLAVHISEVLLYLVFSATFSAWYNVEKEASAWWQPEPGQPNLTNVIKCLLRGQKNTTLQTTISILIAYKDRNSYHRTNKNATWRWREPTCLSLKGLLMNVISCQPSFN